MLYEELIVALLKTIYYEKNYFIFCLLLYVPLEQVVQTCHLGHAWQKL